METIEEVLKKDPRRQSMVCLSINAVVTTLKNKIGQDIEYYEFL